MLSQIKNFIKENQGDIILIISIILIALISFGAGRLSVSKKEKEPIIIERPAASLLGNLATSSEGTSLPAGDLSDNIAKGIFVASKNSKYYHWPQSPYAQKIKPENQIWFKTEAEAQAAGFIRASNFKDFAPADYKP